MALCHMPGDLLMESLPDLQGIGILSAAIVSLVTLSCFHHSIVNYGENSFLPP